MSVDPRKSFTVKKERLAEKPSRRRRRTRLPITVLLLGCAAASLFIGFWFLDVYFFGLWREARPEGAYTLPPLVTFDFETVAGALPGLSQVIVAVLGIAITVVSIVVQLAATRYTSRVTNMFFRDRTNLLIMGFFVVACIDAVWTSVAFSSHYIPRATIAVTLAMVTGSLLLLMPYFAYVFEFLDPERIIARIGQQSVDAALGRGRRKRSRTSTRQAIANTGMEHLRDIAVNAVAQKDKIIASEATGALREILCRYLHSKNGLPTTWFALGDKVREDPDFIALAPVSIASLEQDRIWFEWKCLRDLWSVFDEALAHMPEMAHVVAIETRYVGLAALDVGDLPAASVTLKFFNTYVRGTLNARDVRAAYNVLHQYRQLAERVIDSGQDARVRDIGRWFKYYGQTAHGMGLGFVTETAAYDLSMLCQHAFERGPSGAACHDALLQTFLEVDKEAETKAEEKTLRGVRKSQVRLATYYLWKNATVHARTIHNDMQHESRERLASIRAELAAIDSKEFWEVTDRGINFDYLDQAQKAQLDTFFGWFE